VTAVLSNAIIAGLVPLAAFGVLSLAFVEAIHEAAEVAVIAGVRAGRVGRRLRPSPLCRVSSSRGPWRRPSEGSRSDQRILYSRGVPTTGAGP